MVVRHLSLGLMPDFVIHYHPGVSWLPWYLLSLFWWSLGEGVGWSLMGKSYPLVTLFDMPHQWHASF